jgi:hypothetical protein
MEIMPLHFDFPLDIWNVICRHKFNIETATYDAFLEDIEIDILHTKEYDNRSEREIAYDLIPQWRVLYTIKMTYKPRNKHILCKYTTDKLTGQPLPDKYVIVRHFAGKIGYFTKGHWKRTDNNTGDYDYYHTDGRAGCISVALYTSWRKQVDYMKSLLGTKRFAKFAQVI